MQAVAGNWEFDLFINGQSRRSVFAQENLRTFCREYLDGKCHIRIINMAEHPEQAAKNKICVCPTLIVRRPLPEKTLVGDLSNTSRVLECLNLGYYKEMPADKKAYREGLAKQRVHCITQHERRQR